jgi:hypothetical protein
MWIVNKNIKKKKKKKKGDVNSVLQSCSGTCTLFVKHAHCLSLLSPAFLGIMWLAPKHKYFQGIVFKVIVDKFSRED